MYIPPPLPSGERFSLSFLPVTDVSEPGFCWLNFSNRLGTGAEIQKFKRWEPEGREHRLRMFQSDCLLFFSPGREETGQWTGVLREPQHTHHPVGGPSDPRVRDRAGSDPCTAPALILDCIGCPRWIFWAPGYSQVPQDPHHMVSA